mmetsp:Transcript_2848/g.6055  ORF Transcript_2848/g.6055 Transcript_2848/m.6055 type:complete len:486 (-) Transcript_2848:1-1458(-)
MSEQEDDLSAHIDDDVFVDQAAFDGGGGGNGPIYEIQDVRLEETLIDDLQKVKANDPSLTEFEASGSYGLFRVLTDEDWEQLGRGVTKSDFLETLCLYEGALDDQRMSSLFRGLTMSDSIQRVSLCSNGLSDSGLGRMVPFLQNSSRLNFLNLSHNNITSGGLSSLLSALRDSPIKELYCGGCGLDSINIDMNSIPPNLLVLSMCNNNINADGCRELAKMLQGETVTLRELYLDENKIDDEGVGILVDALQNNTSLEYLNLENNGGITNNGLKLLLKLVNDVSSINSTLLSNHTLQTSGLSALNKDSAPNEIEKQIRHALVINQENAGDSAAAGREKVISTQLNSLTRKELCRQQGIDECNFYSQINDLHLPEVLSLVARTHGHGELFEALVASVASLFSTVNRSQCQQQQCDERERYLVQQAAEHTDEAVHHAAISAQHAAIAAQHANRAERMRAELIAIRQARAMQFQAAGGEGVDRIKRRRI